MLKPVCAVKDYPTSPYLFMYDIDYKLCLHNTYFKSTNQQQRHSELVPLEQVLKGSPHLERLFYEQRPQLPGVS